MVEDVVHAVQCRVLCHTPHYTRCYLTLMLLVYAHVIVMLLDPRAHVTPRATIMSQHTVLLHLLCDPLMHNACTTIHSC